MDAKLAALGGTTGARGRGGSGGAGTPPPPPDLVAINGALSQQLMTLENGDMAPTEAMRKGYVAECSNLKTALASWNAINSGDLLTFNVILARNSSKPAAPSTPVLFPPCS